MKLNLSSKKLESNTHYIRPNKDFFLNNENDINFFISQIQEEVVNLSKKTLRRYQSICIKTIATFTSTLMLGTQMAFTNQATTVSASDSIQVKIQHVDGFDMSDILGWGLWIIGGMIVVGGIIAAGCWILAGLQKVIYGGKKKKEAIEWQKNIITGFSDVLLAPVIIGLLCLAAILFFGHFDWYVKPFQGYLGNQ